MSVTYSAIKWNHNKRVYDAVIVTGVVVYLALFGLISWLTRPAIEAISPEVLAIRALGTCAFLMLHVTLCLGPLARLDRRLLPLVYNRRHLGVATFLMGLAHAVVATGFYHGFGRLNPLVSLLVSNTNYGSLTAFPFEMLGIAALAILFVMAATSHDFWQKNLGPSVWKGMHMLAYPAYALLVWHVALGGLQSERSIVYPAIAALGVSIVVILHLVVGLRERNKDQGTPGTLVSDGSQWIDVGSVDEIVDCRAKVVCLAGHERIAVFRYDGLISAVTNVCAHQRGPLGEGRIVDGCITCPWHGWEYRPDTGVSPPPFNERIATYRVKVSDGRILVDPSPLPPGTPVEPARSEEYSHA